MANEFDNLNEILKTPFTKINRKIENCTVAFYGRIPPIKKRLPLKISLDYI